MGPGLNGKKDAVPGRIHPLTIEADEPGEYIGQCTEFCGLSHAEMRIKVVACARPTSRPGPTSSKPFKTPSEAASADASPAGRPSGQPVTWLPRSSA